MTAARCHVPAVSVCIPVYLGEEYLGVAIESVLAQTFTDFELVVLDNCSPDRSAQIAASYADPRIRIEHNRTVLPVTDNWNAAVRATRAPLVKLLCDDDLLHPRCLELQVEALRQDPDLAVVAARQHLIDRDGAILVPARWLRGLLGPRTHSQVVRRVVRSGANPIGVIGGWTFRRSAFDASEGFAAAKVFVADLDLLVALTEHGGFRGQRESLAAYRIVSSSLLAGAGRDEFRVQKAFMRELSHAPDGRVSILDVLVGAVTAPLPRLRRVAMFAVASRLPVGR